MAQHLSNDQFLDRLASLLTTHGAASHGSIFFTQKRLSHPTDPANPTSTKKSTSDLSDLTPPADPLPVLIRATDGKRGDERKSRVKLSTVVQPDALEGFFTRYAEVCKSGMGALKKRDRKARKAKDKKKKGKGGAVNETAK